MNKIKTIIIDDEPLGREIIREYLQDHNDVEIMAECKDAHEALEAIESHNPDLIFLDISMPEIDGFELLRMLDKMPFVIFSTAYNQYAVNAFEVNAVDYLLKPYDHERFDTALNKVRQQIIHRDKTEKDNIEKLLMTIRNKYLKRIMVKYGGKIVIVNTTEIIRAEAVEDYVNLFTPEARYLISQPLLYLENRLDPEYFVRVHRSHIINLRFLKELQPWSNGRFKCIMKDNSTIIVSRSGIKKLKMIME